MGRRPKASSQKANSQLQAVRRPRSNTLKAQREIARRIEINKARRFNDPFKLFIQRKYPKIYKEYQMFYEYLDMLNPELKNLTKSAQFKKWMNENQMLLDSELEVELIPRKLAEIMVSLRKVQTSLLTKTKDVEDKDVEGEATLGDLMVDQTSLHENVTVMNESEATLGDLMVDQTSLHENVTVMNEGEATLGDLVDELLEDDLWQELLNQNLSGIYEHFETEGF